MVADHKPLSVWKPRYDVSFVLRFQFVQQFVEKIGKVVRLTPASFSPIVVNQGIPTDELSPESKSAVGFAVTVAIDA